MEHTTVAEALSLSSGNFTYQNKLLLVLSLTIFSFTNLIFSITFLISGDPKASNITNSFKLFNADSQKRFNLKYAVLFSVPLGGLLMSYLSDSFGRIYILRNLLVYEIVFLVYAGICLSMNVLGLSCFFLGLMAFGGFSTSLLLIIENTCERFSGFYTGGILFSIFFSIFASASGYFTGVHWRIPIFLSAFSGLVALKMIKNCFESSEWLYSSQKFVEAERILIKISQANGKLENFELEERFESEKDKFVSNWNYLCIGVLWGIFGLTLSLVNNLAYKGFYNNYLEKMVLGGTGMTVSAMIMYFSRFETEMQYFWISSLVSKILIAFLYLDKELAVLAVALYIIVVAFLSYEIHALVIMTTKITRIKTRNKAFGVFNALFCICAFLVCFSSRSAISQTSLNALALVFTFISIVLAQSLQYKLNRPLIENPLSDF